MGNQLSFLLKIFHLFGFLNHGVFFFFFRNGCSCTWFLDLYLLCVSVWLLRKRRNTKEGEFSYVVFTRNPLFDDFCDG